MTETQEPRTEALADAVIGAAAKMIAALRPLSQDDRITALAVASKAVIEPDLRARLLGVRPQPVPSLLDHIATLEAAAADRDRAGIDVERLRAAIVNAESPNRNPRRRWRAIASAQDVVFAARDIAAQYALLAPTTSPEAV